MGTLSGPGPNGSSGYRENNRYRYWRISFPSERIQPNFPEPDFRAISVDHGALLMAGLTKFSVPMPDNHLEHLRLKLNRIAARPALPVREVTKYGCRDDRTSR